MEQMEGVSYEETLEALGVVLTVPESFVGAVHAPQVVLSFRPRSIEEFDLIVEAGGGRGAWRWPVTDPGYWDTPAYSIERARSGLRVALYPPPREALNETVAAPVSRPHPFFERYAEPAVAESS